MRIVKMAKKKRYILLCLIMLLAGCGLFKKKKPPPPPEPTRVVIQFEATADINLNAEGRSSPLYVHIYQLRSYSDFGKAGFFSLYDKADQVLGKALIDQQEILLKPNEKRTVFFETPDDTQTIGLVGLFMEYITAKWKTAAGVQANKTTVINVTIDGTGIMVR